LAQWPNGGVVETATSSQFNFFSRPIAAAFIAFVFRRELDGQYLSEDG